MKAARTGLREAPVTVLLGARQTGKTTLAGMLAKNHKRLHVFDLESAPARRALEAPEIALRGLRGLVVIDEIQRMPGLYEVLRPLADRRPRPARFLILGSASPDLVRGASETLAGRAFFVQVPGFSIDEVGPERMNRLWLRGGFPRSFLAPGEAASIRWREGFAATFLERDIPQLGIRIPAPALRRFWVMLAHCHGQTWNASELARAMSVTPKTARHYLDVLSGALLVRVLPPWHENLRKRQVKAPKIYLRDSGLLHHLLGIESMGALRSHPRYGASWEGFALEQVLALAGERDAYFWSTQRGAELDLLLLRKGKRYGFEFKCADAPGMTRSVHVALEDLGLAALYVVYPGADRYRLHEKVEALPLAELTKLRWRE
ncbi:MAG: ATP-binding protein [Candidatus Eisenbacteria bacterium]